MSNPSRVAISKAEQLALRAMEVDLQGARARVAELQKAIDEMEQYEVDMHLEISTKNGLLPEEWTWSVKDPEVITLLPPPAGEPAG